MKTPREILLEQHRTATPKLNAIRETAVAALGDPCRTKAMNHRSSLYEFLFSLRWHLAGMSAVWLVVALLSLNASQPPGPMAAEIFAPSVPLDRAARN